jgi:hypothetical protein
MCQLTALRGCYEPSNGVVELTVNRAIVEGDKYVLQYVIFDITGMSCGDIEESTALSELIACVPHPNVTIDVVFPARVTHLRHARFHSSFTLNYVCAGFGLIATMLLNIAAYKVDFIGPTKPNKSTYSEL